MTQTDSSVTTRPGGTVTGRYRRRPAPWFWAALVLIPLVLALLGWFAGHDGSTPTPAASPTTQAAPTQQTPARWPVEVTGDKTSATVTATVADTAAKTALLDAVKQGLPGAQIEDRVSVVAGQAGTEAGGLTAVLQQAAGKFEDFGVRVTDGAVAVRGTAPDQGTLDAVGATAKGAFPGHTVSTEFTRGAPSPTGPLSCNDIQTQIAQRLAAHPVTFDHAAAQVSAASRERLTEIGKGLAGCGATGIVVRGHTDATGSPATNDRLSTERAAAVRQILVSAGVAADHVTSEGVGPREPVAFNDSEAGRAQNRRVEIRVGSETR